jgi:hypothetical protein
LPRRSINTRTATQQRFNLNHGDLDSPASLGQRARFREWRTRSGPTAIAPANARLDATSL